MAGNPKKREMIEELERRTRDRFPDEEERTILDYVGTWLADGQTFRALARDLRVSYSLLYDFLNHRFGSESVRSTFSRAREVGALALADETIDIADETVGKEDAPAARLQVQARQWVAERWNKTDLGAAKGGTVQVNIGQLMLTALQQPAPPRPVIAPVIADEAEVLSLEPTTSSKSE